MINLFFGDLFSILTLVTVIGLTVLIAIAVKKRQSIGKWGRLILLFVIVGTAVSALSAARDAYMSPGALFATQSIQSVICSVTGCLIYLFGILSIFFKKQNIKRIFFYFMSSIFAVQVIVIEASRIVLYTKGII